MYLDGAETDRLLIRKLDAGDIITWQSFFIDNESLPFLGIDLSLDAYAQSRDWIERQLWRYANNKFGHHALIEKQTNIFIGQCGLLTQEIENQAEIEIGYHILPAYWGKGYATEAARKFRDYAFENDICSSLISIIDTRNTASQHVAEKLGMSITRRTNYLNLDVYIYRVEKGNG